MKVNTLILFIISLQLMSCQQIMSKLYGVQPLTAINQQGNEEFISELDFDKFTHEARTVEKQYFETIKNFADEDTVLLKYLYQPLQAWYFKEDSLVSVHLNCLVPGGVQYLRWNYQDRFNSFPPHSAVNTSELNINLIDLLRLNDISKKPKEDYIVFIYWTSMMSKQAKYFINLILENIKQNNKSNIEFYIINTDALYLEEKPSR